MLTVTRLTRNGYGAFAQESSEKPLSYLSAYAAVRKRRRSRIEGRHPLDPYLYYIISPLFCTACQLVLLAATEVTLAHLITLPSPYRDSEMSWSP